jgi:hypothetical protein
MPISGFRIRASLCFALLAASAAAEEWPFGAGGDPFSKRDFYNLGPLGAKASDADGPKPAPNEPPRGGVRAVKMDDSIGDDGPARLRIEFLFPGGPAEKAGIAPGDVISGVENARFEEGSLTALAKAILRAEASNGKVTLHVVPSGGAARKVAVTIPAAGREAARPNEGRGRRAVAKAALRWLAARQEESGGYRETLCGPIGAVVQASVAGLAWLGGGSDLAQGPHRANVKKAADFVAAASRTLSEGVASRKVSGVNTDQCNWGYCHAAIFLGELQARTPDDGVKEALHFCARRLLETQEESGGWAHGPGGPNGLDYVELNIVTGLALCGLGLAQQAGFALPKEALGKADAYLRESGSGDGGVGYSTQPGQKGQGNIGRTAAAWLGHLALGLAKEAWTRKMGGYVERHADAMFEGHASLMQHFLLAGVAAHAHGNEARKRYWEVALRDLVLARAPDGSLQPRPWRESLSMGSNSDVSLGEVWTTAAWCCVLVSDSGAKEGFAGFPAWTAAALR